MKRQYHRNDPRIEQDELIGRISKYGTKLAYFASNGYTPHYYQLLFHTADQKDGNTVRFRHLAAGRRGGKTLSACWEVGYYLTFPERFWAECHGIDGKDDPLWAYALTENYKRLIPAYRAFKATLIQAGLVAGRDFKEYKGDKYFEFPDGSLIEFRSADEPDSLRGAGLDILWMDESAFIRTGDAWNVVRPALADKRGIVISTTTPNQRNWYWEEFWQGQVLEADDQFRVAYWSLDNVVGFPEDEWLTVKKSMHPLLFAQEFMADFDAMKGNALDASWLHYYSNADIDLADLDIYIGVDPAISLNDKADRFVITAIGVNRTNGKTYLIDQWAGRIMFPEQIEMINDWYLRFQPILVGVENVAYQAALAQQLSRLPDIIPVMEVQAKGKKFERILAMSPLFKAERVYIQKSHVDFIDEWMDYDPEGTKNTKDDCLDSMEIALRTAGVLLPNIEPTEQPFTLLPRDLSIQQQIRARLDRLAAAANRDSETAEDQWFNGV